MTRAGGVQFTQSRDYMCHAPARLSDGRSVPVPGSRRDRGVPARPAMQRQASSAQQAGHLRRCKPLQSAYLNEGLACAADTAASWPAVLAWCPARMNWSSSRKMSGRRAGTGVMVQVGSEHTAAFSAGEERGLLGRGEKLDPTRNDCQTAGLPPWHAQRSLTWLGVFSRRRSAAGIHSCAPGDAGTAGRVQVAQRQAQQQPLLQSHSEPSGWQALGSAPQAQ